MPDKVEPATSGRAKCRGCGRPIVKGDLRFGEAAENPYGEGESTLWFHLGCAACSRPEKFAPMLESAAMPEPEREDLRMLTRAGVAHPRLARVARAERASSGRAHCRHCRETIPKDAFRIALQLMENGRMTPIGSIHANCAAGYFGTRDTVVRRIRLTTPNLDEHDLAEIQNEVTKEPRAAAPAEATPAESLGPETIGVEAPGLAKARPATQRESVSGMDEIVRGR